MRKLQKSQKVQSPRSNADLQAIRKKLSQEHLQKCNESFEVAAYIFDLTFQNFSDIIYNKYIQSKMDSYSIVKCLDSVTVTMQGGFIQHDSGQLQSIEKRFTSAEDASFQAQLSFENQQKLSVQRLQTLIQDKQSQCHEQQSLSNINPTNKLVDDLIIGIFQSNQHNWVPNVQPEPTKIDSSARMSLSCVKRSNCLKAKIDYGNNTITNFMTQKKMTLGTNSPASFRSTYIKQQVQHLKDKDLKINPIMVDQDAVIQEDQKVKILREWKLAEQRKAIEQKRIKKQRQLEQKKKAQAKKKLVQMMKRQNITYDSKGGVIGVKLPKYSQFPASSSALQYDLEKKKRKKQIRFLNKIQKQAQGKTIADSTKAGPEESLKNRFQALPYSNQTSHDSEYHIKNQYGESQFIRDKMNYAGSNYQLLKPDYGVSIKEKGNFKQGSFNFKQKFGVYCRAEYEAEHAYQKSSRQNIQKNTLPMMNQQYSTIKKDQYGTMKGEQQRLNKLQGSIHTQINDFDHNSLKVDVQPPRFRLSSDKFTTLPKKTKAQLRRQQKSKKMQLQRFPTDAQLKEIIDDKQLPHFMRSTEARKGIGKSDKRLLQTINPQEFSQKKDKFLVKQSGSPLQKPRKVDTQTKKMLKQVSQPMIGRTTVFFEAEVKLKNQKMLARQKGMNRDKTQPSLFAKNLIESESRLKSTINLPHLPQPPIGKSYGHGILTSTINNMSKTNSQTSLPL